MRNAIFMYACRISLLLAFICTANNAYCGKKSNTYELGPEGEIPYWLCLGYIPINPDKQKMAQTLDLDLLKNLGGEVGIQPEGGKSVSVGGKEYTWKSTAPQPFEINRFRSKIPIVRLFETSKGVAENSAAYLYCDVIAKEDLKAKFLLGSDDCVKVLLNGKEVHKFAGQRPTVGDTDTVDISLKKGSNSLLVRIDNYVRLGGFAGRFTDSNGAPVHSLKVSIPANPQTVPIEKPSSEFSWKKLVEKAPALPIAENENSFGAHIRRTMSLLETSQYTGRAVRIVFYGQSITSQRWTDYLIRFLREKYPKATIEATNYALGGWTMRSLNKTLTHNILSSRPDLLLFHVYGGSLDHWDRIIGEIRTRTCAEIIMRSPHPQIYSSKVHEDGLDKNSVELRAVAAKYGCEFIECRDEWKKYMQVNKMEEKDFLADRIHLNRKGCVLMARLYARHFRKNLEARAWDHMVRWYGARRQFEDHRDDQIILEGKWRDAWRYVTSRGEGNSLKLTFLGNRVDLVLAPGNGSAKVLIDGQAPSKFNLCHGTFPKQDPYGNKTPVVKRYFTGPNMLLETWTLKITEMTNNRRHFKYTLTGSMTGPDGEGDNKHNFVSKSGRIKIFANDARGQKAPPKEEIGPNPNKMVPVQENMEITWKIVSDCKDTVKAVASPPGADPKKAKFTYVTVADGLPFGVHELTIIPDKATSFGIAGVEIYRPPLGEKPLKRD